MRERRAALASRALLTTVVVWATSSPAWADAPVPPPQPAHQATAWKAPKPAHWQPPKPGQWKAPKSHHRKAPNSGRWEPPKSGHRQPPAAPHRSPGSAGVRPGETARRLLDALNRHRARAGCGPVRTHTALNRAAQAHSIHMALHRHLSHTGVGSSTPAERMRAAGYRPRLTGETVTVGPATPEAAVRAWLDSPAHREVILTCRYIHAGVGSVRWSDGLWWTLDLATNKG